MNTKRWFHSRTLWLNFLAAIAVLIQVITGTDWLDAEVQASIIVIANVILRLLTSSGLEK